MWGDTKDKIQWRSGLLYLVKGFWTIYLPSNGDFFHEMITVDCYCCGVRPSFLGLNARGWASGQLRSLHCTVAHITTWTGSSSAQSSASSRPPLKYPRRHSHRGVECEGVCLRPWKGHYHDNDFHAVLFQKPSGWQGGKACHTERVALHFWLRKNVLETHN